MSIAGIKGTLGHIPPIELRPEQEVRTAKPSNGSNFGEMLTNALKEVNDLQTAADGKVESMVLGKGTSPHEAMLALEKADVAFQLMNAVRSKIIRAYEEILRTQI